VSNIEVQLGGRLLKSWDYFVAFVLAAVESGEACSPPTPLPAVAANVTSMPGVNEAPTPVAAPEDTSQVIKSPTPVSSVGTRQKPVQSVEEKHRRTLVTQQTNDREGGTFWKDCLLRFFPCAPDAPSLPAPDTASSPVATSPPAWQLVNPQTGLISIQCVICPGSSGPWYAVQFPSRARPHFEKFLEHLSIHHRGPSAAGTPKDVRPPRKLSRQLEFHVIPPTEPTSGAPHARKRLAVELKKEH